MQLGERAGADLAIAPQRHRDLLVAPLHDVEGEFDDLLRGEVFVQSVDQLVVDLGRKSDERVGEVERRSLLVTQTLAGAESRVDPVLVESVGRGNCQAERQSSVTVVVGRTPQADELGGDRVDAVVADGGCCIAMQRTMQRVVPRHLGGHPRVPRRHD